MTTLGIIVFLTLLGFFAGRQAEKSHFTSIRKREKEFNHIPWSNVGRKVNPNDYLDSKFVSGNVVIAQDYFKTLVAGLVGLIGGRITTYESLLDRGRREALLRLRKEAIDWNADEILNIRFETSNIGMNKQGADSGSIEVFAYATAVKKNEVHT